MEHIITVIGSTNRDMVIQTERFPKPGETLIGHKFTMFSGGKGANQAVAAAKLSDSVQFITRVGDDQFGEISIKELKENNVATEYVYKDKEAPTGVAIIIVNHKGQNSIVVSSGANDFLSKHDIDNSMFAIKNTSIILMQLEIPMETVQYVLQIGSSRNKKIIVNPAPMQPFEDWMYQKLYLITPNESESEMLTGIQIIDNETASLSADFYLNKGVENVVITLGEKGSYFKNKTEEFLVPSKKVEVKDTTGAGDVFNGALAVALAENKDWHEAIEFATIASAIAIGKLGAQSAAPNRQDINEFQKTEPSKEL